MARILVIEDDNAVRCVISAALTAAGHEVLEASDGRAGLRVLGANKIDLVITDILMPDLDGVEFVRTMRAYGSPAKIIAISGGGGALDPVDLLTQAVTIGADAALPKPFQMADLHDLVRAVLMQPDRSSTANAPATRRDGLTVTDSRARLPGARPNRSRSDGSSDG
jgi:DNA-binding response OmpR family regulator